MSDPKDDRIPYEVIAKFDDLAVDWLEANDQKTDDNNYVIRGNGQGRRSLARLLAEVALGKKGDI